MVFQDEERRGRVDERCCWTATKAGAGKERHGPGLGTRQEATGEVFAVIPLPRLIRCRKNVPIALYRSWEVAG